jgi:hypothetical protein
MKGSVHGGMRMAMVMVRERNRLTDNKRNENKNLQNSFNILQQLTLNNE